MNLKANHNQAGFTLVEALLTALLFSLLLGACLVLFLASSDSWQTNSVRVELQQELRKAVDWMRQDLLVAGASTITNVPADGTWDNTISFRTATGVSNGAVVWSGSTIQFQRGGTGSLDLQRVSGAQTKVLAKNISTLQFRRLAASPQLLEVNVIASKTTLKGRSLSNTISFKVALRN